MNFFKRIGLGSMVLSLLIAPALRPSNTYAATSPGLGLADSFVILSNTYTNTVGGTTLTGDLGYTTGPALAPTVNGNTHIADGTYAQAGIDQGTALTNLNGQPCTHTFTSSSGCKRCCQRTTSTRQTYKNHYPQA